MKKRKKILTRLTLCVLLVAMLIPMFSLFSSAAGNTDTSYQSIYPQYLYYWDYVAEDNTRSFAYWDTPVITANDRITFGLMYSSNSDNPWHLYPFVQGQQTSSGTVQYYNQGNASWESDWTVASSLIQSYSFDTYISYTLDGSKSFRVILRLKDSVLSSWNHPWKPMYVIDCYYADRELEQKARVPWGDTAVMSPFASGLVKAGTNTTYYYPFYDCGILIRGFDPYVRAGISFTITEYFYDKDYTYPTIAAAFEDNLYTFNGTEGKFVSYPISYRFYYASDAYNNGYDNGYDDGKEDGYQQGIKISENYNAVDGIVTLAQVPGALVSSMLDFNFFGINLANFVKFLFTMIVIAFIVIIFLKFIL